MRIVLARHGDATNQENKFHGLVDEPITSKGREKAYQLAEELRKYHATAIYYSPLSRCRDTAKILAGELDMPARKAPALKPLDMGDFVGKDVKSNLDEVRHYLKHTRESFPGGESVDHWARNYLPFFEKYFKHKNDETIIFVTHGRCILLSKAYIKKGNLAPDFDKNVLLDSTQTTEHAGHAVATPPDKFQIIDSKAVTAGKS